MGRLLSRHLPAYKKAEKETTKQVKQPKVKKKETTKKAGG